jgi:hypothetical protein
LKLIANQNQAELAAYIHSHLKEQGIDVVLSGGAVVAIYTKGLFVSKDIDLIPFQYIDPRTLTEAMAKIGFTPKGRHFTHLDSEFYVEFPSGPPSMGSESVSEISEIKYSTGILRLLSPTDCIKDRLSAYYHWNDLQTLQQAVSVANENKVDFINIKRWSKGEGKSIEFEYFINLVNSK